MAVNRKDGYIPRKSYFTVSPGYIKNLLGQKGVDEKLVGPLSDTLITIFNKFSVDERLNYDVIERGLSSGGGDFPAPWGSRGDSVFYGLPWYGIFVDDAAALAGTGPAIEFGLDPDAVNPFTGFFISNTTEDLLAGGLGYSSWVVDDAGPFLLMKGPDDGGYAAMFAGDDFGMTEWAGIADEFGYVFIGGGDCNIFLSSAGTDPAVIGIDAEEIGSLHRSLIYCEFDDNTGGDFLQASIGSAFSATLSQATFLMLADTATQTNELGGIAEGINNTAYLWLTESAADPAAPGTNTVRIFSKDNGAGKTQLCARFNTGAVQVIATEP